MRCSNCGNEIAEGSAFCGYCGAKATAEIPSEATSPTGPLLPATKKKNNTPLIVTLIAVFAALIIGLVTFLIISPVSKPSINPSTKPVSKTEVTVDNVVANINAQDYKTAEKLLGKLKAEKKELPEGTIKEIEEILLLQPKIKQVDTIDYPYITIDLETKDSSVQYAADDFEILCDGSFATSISNIAQNANSCKITYMTPASGDSKTVNDSLVFKKYSNVNFAVPFEYKSENDGAEAQLSFVTSNVDKYPEVSLYLKAVDENGNTIDGLSKKSFRIREYLDINDYLERDIIYAEKVNEKDALNVCLAIDRSGSIRDNLGEVKRVTKEFLSKLQYDAGDKAEIIAFETTVMRMCLFTNNRELLTNGIDSMQPTGETACYDAIRKAIYDASTQSGARCAIVFTDGKDNKSKNRNTADIISLAREKGVPVYIIGVGSAEADTLRNIATQTGGWYRHITDYSEMDKMYEQIYREQKDLYRVTYKCNSAIPQNSERRIVVTLNDQGYRGKCNETYTPITPVAPSTHSSRYEVVRADVSWEEADRLALQKGGHLVTITSKEEENQVISAIEKSNTGIKRLWIGGYTTNASGNRAVGHWVTGESFNSYENWYTNSKGKKEPSRFDGGDHEAEYYLMLWNIDSFGWSWNDQRNDLINSPFGSQYKGKMGYVIEYEN